MFSLSGIGDDDDNMDFLAKGTGLKSLFGNPVTAVKPDKISSNEVSSLKYSAPKQPKSSTNSSSSGVQFAAVAQTYVYQDNQYSSKGKLGVAITASKCVMIYGQKQRVISNFKIAPDSIFSVSAKNFITYYDDSRLCWAIMFTNDTETEKFLQQVSFVRYSLGKTLLKQQLNHFDPSKKVSKSDTVVVSYTGWLLENDDLGKEFDTNDHFTVDIPKACVVKGWLESLPDCYVDASYIICIPPEKGYGSREIGDRIPPNSDLVFKITVLKIIPPISKSPVSSTVNDLTDSSSVDSLPVFQAKQQPATSHKTEILTRMARMGAQPALPMTNKGEIPSSPDGDLDHDVRSRSSSLKSNKSRRKNTRASSVSSIGGRTTEEKPEIPAKPGPLIPTYQATQAAYQAAHGSYQATQAAYPAGFVPVNPAPVFNTTHSTVVPQLMETLTVTQSVKDSVKNLETSVNSIENKINSLANQAVLFNQMASSCPSLDTQLLMFNIQRVVTENDGLKAEIKTKNLAVEEKSNKITALLNRNHELMNQKNEAVEQTQNNFLVNSNQASKQIAKLETENELLKNEMKVLKSTGDNCQFEISAKNDQIVSLRSQIENMYTENNKLHSTVFETRNELSSLRMSSSNIGNSEAILNREIEKLKERLNASLEEKLEISQKLDDQVYNDKQSQIQYQNKMKHLESTIKELKSSSATDKITAHYESVVLQMKTEKEELELQINTVTDRCRCELASAKSINDELKVQINSLTSRNNELELAHNNRNEAEIQNHRKTEQDLQETIAALNQEIDSNATVKGHLEDQIRTLKEYVIQLKNENNEVPDSGDSKEAVNATLKHILNDIFRVFRSDVDIEASYSGQDVLTLAMNIIKTATLNAMNSDSSSSSESEEDDDNETDNDDSNGDDNEGGEEERQLEDAINHESRKETAPEELPSSSNSVINSTEFEIPGESSTDFLQPTITVREQPTETQTADESFYSSFSPDYIRGESLFNEVTGVREQSVENQIFSTPPDNRSNPLTVEGALDPSNMISEHHVVEEHNETTEGDVPQREEIDTLPTDTAQPAEPVPQSPMDNDQAEEEPHVQEDTEVNNIIPNIPILADINNNIPTSAEEFLVEEDELWAQHPPVEAPPSPASASFEPNVNHTTVNVEDISALSTEVFGDTPESIQIVPASPANRRSDHAPPPLFSDSEEDDLSFLT